jgi:hypothetical protein
MVGSSKILTVSYGTFSCTLEGFEDPFSTMKSIAEYFRDLAADDRYFGAEPPTPDAEMLHRIAEREVKRRVETRLSSGGIVLRQLDDAEEDLPTPRATAATAPEPEAYRAPPPASAPAAPQDSVASKLSRIRAVVERARATSVQAHPVSAPAASAAGIGAAQALEEDEEADAAPAPQAIEEDQADIPPEVAAGAESAAEIGAEPEPDLDREIGADLAAASSEAAEEPALPDTHEDEDQDDGEAPRPWQVSAAEDAQVEAEADEDDEAPQPRESVTARGWSDEDDFEDEEDEPEDDEDDLEQRIVHLSRAGGHASDDATLAGIRMALDVEKEAIAQERKEARMERRHVLIGRGPDGEPAFDRILEETNTKMADREGTRRRSAIAHLKAAVAATKADRMLKRERSREVDEEEQRDYREDLAKVVRPHRSEPRESASEKVRPKPIDETAAPLILGSSQRVDELGDTAQKIDLRPRRIGAGMIALDEDAGPEDEDTDESDFIAFAEAAGARNLPDLLEAAAAYTAFVEQRPSFSRPQIMRRAAAIETDEEFTREAGLRSFGQLLRQGKIRKLQRGQFTISENTRFHPEARIAGE